MRHRFLALLAILLMAGSQMPVKAQSVALRTNVAGFSVMAANIGVDYVFNASNSLSTTFYQTLGESWIKHTQATGLQVSWRHWFSQEPMRGLFWGLSVGVGTYDLELERTLPDIGYEGPMKYSGTALPMSIDIGYSFFLSRRWSLDIYAGIGPLFRWETSKFDPLGLGEETYIPRRFRTDFYPTNAGVSLVCIIM